MPPAPRKNNLSGRLRISDLRGLTRLATQATVGVTRITEGVHQSVLGTLGFAAREPQRSGGLTGLIYRSIGGITRGAGWGIEAALAGLQPLLDKDGASDADGNEPESERRVALISALNGVMGDRLEADNSPFAIEMNLRQQGAKLDLQAPLQIPAASGKILLMIHGLCMNDLQWRCIENGQPHDHGQIIAAALGFTQVHLRYNSGRHISHNGRELAGLLEQLLKNWPVAVEQVCVLAHSMGGLLIRSAIHQASQQGLTWPTRLKHVVFLGTPHHGAPLESAGHGVELLLAGLPWTAPFSRLTGLRSAGITDLRHGNVLDEDWQQGAEPGRRGDTRVPLPLPAGIGCHTIAATTAARRSPLADRLVGDGLVPVHSALGKHREARHCLAFADDSTWITYRTGHLALLSRPAVSERILRWLAS